MPQSLARLHVHLIFSTKNRALLITDDVRDPLHRYIATVLKNLGCHPVLINSVEDHIHILVDLVRTASVSEVVGDIKSDTSKWIKTQGHRHTNFAWQGGYGAFDVDASSLDAVRRYIESQREHHHEETFQEEFRRLLKANGIEFDEQYVWD